MAPLDLRLEPSPDLDSSLQETAKKPPRNRQEARVYLRIPKVSGCPVGSLGAKSLDGLIVEETFNLYMVTQYG